jgi:outer membrane immunogenic protein
MKKILLGAIAIAALSTTAFAADLPARTYTKAPLTQMVPAYDWSGWYVGVNGGYGEATNLVVGHLDDNPQGIKPTGGFGGGQVGYNWQFSNFVLGVEADIQGSGIKKTVTDVNFLDTFSSKLNWFGTVRGRFGVALAPSLLAYATGGFAYGNIVVDASGPVLTGGPFHYDNIRTGYAVGGGLEWKFMPSWSIKGEYQYLDFGRATPVNAAGLAYNGPTFNTRRFVNDQRFNTVRLGLNYGFGGPVVAKY